MRHLVHGVLALVTAVAATVVATPALADPAIFFPVEKDPSLSYTDTFGACRAGCTRSHLGVDMMADQMTRVFATVDGTISSAHTDPDSYGLRLDGDDGRTYFYLHLNDDTPGRPAGCDHAGGLDNAFSPRLAAAAAAGDLVGLRVERAELLGYIGSSGNAGCGVDHLHLEVWPGHGWGAQDNALNPYPIVAEADVEGNRVEDGEDGPGGPLPPPPPPTPSHEWLTGDWDGDGVDTLARFTDGMWEFWDTWRSGGPDWTLAYGQAGDKPVTGDWDGDGVDTVGVVRGNLWILRSEYRRGADDVVMAYGEASDKPVTGDWDRDGVDTLGVVRGNLWILRSEYRRGADDVVMAYGETTDLPITGDWNGDDRDTLGVRRAPLVIFRSAYQRGSDFVYEIE
ncbi:MAG TPA: M23 family metallopeptidase [Nitriliruptoraceae bacterium]|nr:M23 family metallopeptidase [Nitriliruptoraceae bacterium]